MGELGLDVRATRARMKVRHAKAARAAFMSSADISSAEHGAAGFAQPTKIS